jgi:phage terminase large subunit-like protein
VEHVVADLAQRYNRGKVVVDPYQAIQLCERLRRRGLTVVEHPFTTKTNETRATTIYRLFRDRGIAIPNDKALIAELERVELRETCTGTVRIDHAADAHDDQATAIGLAAVAPLERPASPVAGDG